MVTVELLADADRQVALAEIVVPARTRSVRRFDSRVRHSKYVGSSIEDELPIDMPVAKRRGYPDGEARYVDQSERVCYLPDTSYSDAVILTTS